jgi:SPX domain protein involved in polyphosphate accumulation
MKFGKNLIHVVELSDPEWGSYWINYKFMKKKINDIITTQGSVRISEAQMICSPREILDISESSAEIDFFRLLKTELKKTCNFFSSAEQLYRIRYLRVSNTFMMLKDRSVIYDKNSWQRLLAACVKFYKDVLLLENFAIMNYCGFSKILKKHDKSTGFHTREAFMRNVMSQQNITNYPYVLELLKESEKLYKDIQEMESCRPLRDEEQLFIEAIRDLNRQASRLQAEENQEDLDHTDNKDLIFPSKRSSSSKSEALFESEPHELETTGGLDTIIAVEAASNVAIEAAQKANHNCESLEDHLTWIKDYKPGDCRPRKHKKANDE